MKTIFDKIDPKYIEHATQGAECSTGMCVHTYHTHNIAILGIIIATTVYLVLKTRTTSHN